MGEALRTLRTRRHLTQDALAAKSKISQNQISKLETGAASRPTYATVRALAQALDVEMQQLRFTARRRPR